jgi:hypothetical protein
MPRCAVALRSRFQKGMARARLGRGIACVNEIRPHCVNQLGKAKSKPLATRQGRRTAWARRGNGMVCVNMHLVFTLLHFVIPPCGIGRCLLGDCAAYIFILFISTKLCCVTFRKAVLYSFLSPFFRFVFLILPSVCYFLL